MAPLDTSLSDAGARSCHPCDCATLGKPRLQRQVPVHHLTTEGKIVELITHQIFFFLAVPRGTWDLSSQTRDQTQAPCIGSMQS